jgi:hypothetical protein
MACIVLIVVWNKSARLIRKGGVMENKKTWMELCERAADEQDPKKLAALILEINFMLEAKELRLVGKVVTQPPVKNSLTALNYSINDRRHSTFPEDKKY